MSGSGHETGGDESVHGQGGERAHEQVGTLAEEALRLFGALAGAARQHGPDPHEHGAHEHGAHEHGAEAPECAWCPLCRALRTVRRTSPEVRAHLMTAASALVQAAAAAMATVAPEPDPEADRREGRGPGVETIDLDEGPEDWPEEDA